MKPRAVAATLAVTLTLSLSAAACAANQPAAAPAPAASPTASDSASTGVGMPMPSATATFIQSASPIEVPSSEPPSTPAPPELAQPKPIAVPAPSPRRKAKKVSSKLPSGPPLHHEAPGQRVPTPPNRPPKGAAVAVAAIPRAKTDPQAENKPLAPYAAGNVVTEGAHPNTLCNQPGANIYEHHKNDWGFRQQTYYCWSATGYGVYSLGFGNLQAWSSDSNVAWIQQLDNQWTQCYPFVYQNGFKIARGNCVQTTYGHYHVYASGGVGLDILGTGGSVQVTKDQNINVWTEVNVWFNGYAECANSHDPKWTRCNNSAP